jgi:integrase
VRRGIWQDPATVPAPAAQKAIPTFHEFASEWFAAHKIDGGHRGQGLAPRSVEDLEWRLSTHLLPAFAHLRLDELTVEHVDRFRRRKVQEGLSASSTNKLLSCLSAILEQAQEYGHVERNVAAGRRRRLPQTPPSRTYIARADHIAALVNAAEAMDAGARGEPYRRPLVAALILAGPRISEALALTWADVDLTRDTLTVRAGKTHAAARTIPLLPFLSDALAAHRDHLRDGVARMDRLAPETLVFATTSGKPLSASNVRNRIIGPACEAVNAELAKAGEAPMARIGPHSMRRTFASIPDALGEAPPFVMRAMGHTSPNLALGMYAQVIDRRDGEPERLRELVESRPKRHGKGTSGDVAPLAASR